MTGKEQMVYDLSSGRTVWYLSADEAGQALGMDRTTMQKKIKEWGILKITPGRKGKYSVRDIADHAYQPHE